MLFFHRDSAGGALGDVEIPIINSLVSDKKIFSRLPYISLCKSFDPEAGPSLAQGVLFEQTW